MRLLVVEDDQSFLDDLLPLLSGLPGSPEIEIAKSRDSALHLVRKQFFDLLVLDLKLPTVEGGLDLKIEHGYAVFAESQSVAPEPLFLYSPAHLLMTSFPTFWEKPNGSTFGASAYKEGR